MKGEVDMAGTLEYEELNKNLEVVDGHAVKAPEDYQDPEQLYQALIARVRKYHPSADITMIEKKLIKIRYASQESHILSILCGSGSFLLNWRWIKRRSLPVCCMT